MEIGSKVRSSDPQRDASQVPLSPSIVSIPIRFLGLKIVRLKNNKFQAISRLESDYMDSPRFFIYFRYDVALLIYRWRDPFGVGLFLPQD